MTHSKFRLLFLAILFFIAREMALGQNLDSLLNNKRVYQTVNIGDLALPKIDGRLDDEIWTLGTWHGNFTQQQPVGGVPGSERTYIKVLYDRSNLFVAIICQDSEPGLIRDIFDRRDALNGDMTGIALDSYKDRRTAFEFNLSAAGQKMDQWQYIPLQAPAMVYLFGELQGLEQIRGSRQIELLPYVSAGLEKMANREGGPTFRPSAGLDAKLGISSDYTLDLSINPDYGQVEADPSVLNLTAFETFYQEKRPFFMEGNDIFDFELDGDIPYYSRRIGSAPDFPGSMDAWNITDLPRQTTLLGAAKLTGKSSKGMSIGVVNGLTANEYATARNQEGEEREIQVQPMSNYFSSRVKKEFNEGNTILGGVFSLVNRITSDSILTKMLPSSAISGGVDLLHYWNSKNYYFQVKSVGSQIQGSREAIFRKQLSSIQLFQRSDAAYLTADSTREQLGGHGGLVQFGKKGGAFNFDLLGQYRSPGLNLNDMGFIRQADFVGQGVNIKYRMNEPGDWVRNYEIELSQEAQWSFGGENTQNKSGTDFSISSNNLWKYYISYAYDFSHLDTRELRGGPALRVDGEHQTGLSVSSNNAKDLSGNAGFHYNVYGVGDSHQEVLYGGLTWTPFRKLKLSGQVSYNNRVYHQQYVNTLRRDKETLYITGYIEQQTISLTFRGELFINAELSIQYYGSPYYSVGKYDRFGNIDQARSKDLSQRSRALDLSYDEAMNTYSFEHHGASWSFYNPDFSFMQFRSNLVLRWEYKLGSTLYNPVSDITGDLLGLPGNNVVMFKLNFWFSV